MPPVRDKKLHAAPCGGFKHRLHLRQSCIMYIFKSGSGEYGFPLSLLCGLPAFSSHLIFLSSSPRSVFRSFQSSCNTAASCAVTIYSFSRLIPWLGSEKHSKSTSCERSVAEGTSCPGRLRVTPLVDIPCGITTCPSSGFFAHYHTSCKCPVIRGLSGSRRNFVGSVLPKTCRLGVHRC